MAVDIEFSKCTGNELTCSVAAKMVTGVEFFEIVGTPTVEDRTTHKALGDMVTMCVMGDCPGRHPERALGVIRRIIENRPTEP